MVTGVVIIGELAARFGLRASALRYYERRGLLTPTSRVGGRRCYDERAVRRLAFIRLGQAAGLSLEEIALLLDSGDGARWRATVSRRVACIAAEITELELARSLLERSLLCPADHPLEECPYVGAEVSKLCLASENRDTSRKLPPSPGGSGRDPALRAAAKCYARPAYRPPGRRDGRDAGARPSA